MHPLRPLRCPYCSGGRTTDYDYDHRAHCDDCDSTFTEFQEARYLFHAIWTRCAKDGVPEGGYMKAEFNQLRELLDL